MNTKKKEPRDIKINTPRIRARALSQKNEGKPSIVREKRTMTRLQGGQCIVAILTDMLLLLGTFVIRVWVLKCLFRNNDFKL